MTVMCIDTQPAIQGCSPVSQQQNEQHWCLKPAENGRGSINSYATYSLAFWSEKG